jgi:hypothetical protein
MPGREECDQAVERWLRTGVVQAYDELEADPGSAIPAEAVFAAMRSRSRGQKVRTE